MENNNYLKLYKLQDKVLDIVNSAAEGFYLTGGTALGRFYFNHRYSDDLDLFTHDVSLFSDSFRFIYAKLSEEYSEINLDVNARDFKRMIITDNTSLLKIDFVADRTVRTGLPVVIRGILVDNLRNILTNKICAVLGRDEGRDTADIIIIAKNRAFSWPEIINDAMKKESFILEDLIYRLSTFPLSMLDPIPFIINRDKEDDMKILSMIIRDIENSLENSVSDPDAQRL